MIKRSILFLMLLCPLAGPAHAASLGPEDARKDLDSLVTLLRAIHPDPFSEYPEERFDRDVKAVRDSFTDSLNEAEFFTRIGALFTPLGDGHTMVNLPADFIHKNLKFLDLPVTVDLNDPGLFVALDDDLREGLADATYRILSINGVPSGEIIDRMLEYCSGERMFFRLAKVQRQFQPFLAMFYPADAYRLELQGSDGTTVREFDAVPQEECVRFNLLDLNPKENYAFRITDDGKTMIMEFNAFSDLKKFTSFADSMFRVCRKKEIQHLVIDLRRNGGGNSALGDELLKYLTDKKFRQFDPSVINNTPFVRSKVPKAMVQYMEGLPEGVVRTGTPDFLRTDLSYQRFEGEVYVLVSHTTFSSAASLPWVIKKLRIGPVIGEETGGMNVTYGNILNGRLPASGLRWQISFARMYLWGASDKKIHGVIPDIEVPADTALEYVLDLIGKKR